MRSLLVFLLLQVPESAAIGQDTANPVQAVDTAPAAVAGADSLRAASGADAVGAVLPPRIIVEMAEGTSSRWFKDLLPSLVAVLSLLGALVTTTYQLIQKNRELADLRQQRAEEAQRQDQATATALDRQLDEEERRRIAAELNDFYYPVKRHLDVSKLLYDQLLRAQPQPSDFRALISLLRGDEFTPNQRALIDEIINTNIETRRLILSGKASVTDPKLAKLLAAAAFHFRVMELASKKALTAGDDEALTRFSDATYPRELNDEVEEAIKGHESRLRQLETRISEGDRGPQHGRTFG